MKSCVRINGMSTDFFDVKCGLKQGCLFSPLLFNLYIDDLIRDMNLLNIGIKIDDEKICILFTLMTSYLSRTQRRIYKLF